MGKKIRTEEVDHLFEAILCLKNKEECYTFFEDVCTINELLSLSQRFEVAKMLTDKRTYLDISEKTGASTATISRVNGARRIEDPYGSFFLLNNFPNTQGDAAGTPVSSLKPRGQEGGSLRGELRPSQTPRYFPPSGVFHFCEVINS